MNKLLIQNNTILGVDPEVTSDAYVFPDAIIPKQICEDAYLVTVPSLPDDYQPGKYVWTNGAFDPVAQIIPPPFVPQSVTMRQARLALLQAGLLTTVANSISAADQAAQIEWEYANEVIRSSGLIPTMATALGMTETQIDELFILAATL